ncbi:Aldehyde/histidinol dehydrogenase [Ochromonadaceae sp. CCMP2298]|nr:Aldehyde/histidinol dehydrogenase [Ochromonadaceae sp. CCMP2298]
MSKLGNYIDGKFVAPESENLRDVLSPHDGKVVRCVVESTAEDVKAAVKCGADAFEKWSLLSSKERAAKLLLMYHAIEQHLDELAGIISLESGKSRVEAVAELREGMEVLRWAAALPYQSRARQQQLSDGLVCQESRRAVGVVVAITPFCSPVLAPLWTIPLALVLGNCVILKPSSRAPSAMVRVLELMDKSWLSAAGAGSDPCLPPGVLQIIHGNCDIALDLCKQPDVRAVTFVGGTQGAQGVYHYGSGMSRRVMALGTLRNIVLALPDCDTDRAAAQVVGSFTHCAGQSAMAARLLLLVGGSRDSPLLQKILEGVGALGGKGGQVGPMIDKASYGRAVTTVRQAAARGGELLVDGTDPNTGWGTGTAPSAPFFLGPTVVLLSEWTEEQVVCAGPVLLVYCPATREEAVAIERANPHGNAACVFTESGTAADWFLRRLNASLVGVNSTHPRTAGPFCYGGQLGLSQFGYPGGGEAAEDFFSDRVLTASAWTGYSLRYQPPPPSAPLLPPLLHSPPPS